MNHREGDSLSGRCLDVVGSCSGCRGGGVRMSSHTPTHLQLALRPFSFDGSTCQRALTRSILVPCICHSRAPNRRPTLDIGWSEEFPPDDCSNGSCGYIPYLWVCNDHLGRNLGTIGSELVGQTGCFPRLEGMWPDTRHKSCSCHNSCSLEPPTSWRTTNFVPFCASAQDTSRANLWRFQQKCTGLASRILLTGSRGTWRSQAH